MDDLFAIAAAVVIGVFALWLYAAVALGVLVYLGPFSFYAIFVFGSLMVFSAVMTALEKIIVPAETLRASARQTSILLVIGLLVALAHIDVINLALSLYREFMTWGPVAWIPATPLAIANTFNIPAIWDFIGLPDPSSRTLFLWHIFPMLEKVSYISVINREALAIIEALSGLQDPRALIACSILFKLSCVWPLVYLGRGLKTRSVYDRTHEDEPAYRSYFSREGMIEADAALNRMTHDPNHRVDETVRKLLDDIGDTWWVAWFFFVIIIPPLLLIKVVAVNFRVLLTIFHRVLVALRKAAHAYTTFLIRSLEKIDIKLRRGLTHCPNSGCYEPIDQPHYECPECSLRHESLVAENSVSSEGVAPVT